MLNNIKFFFKPQLCIIYAYIILSFIANPPIMPAIYRTYCIYLIIGYSVFLMLIKKTVFWNKYITWRLITIVLCIVSIIYAHHKNVAFDSIYLLFISIIFGLSFVQLISSKQEIKNILLVLALSGGILYILMSQNGLLEVTGRLGNDFSGNANAFSNTILMSTLAAICCIYLYKSRIIWVIMILIIIFNYHMLLLAEGRKSIIAPILFILVLTFKSTGFKFTRVAIITTFTLLILPIVFEFLINYNIISESLVRRFEMTAALVEGNSIDTNIGDIERQIMVEKGFDYFTMSPIWGNGHCNFSYLYSLDSSDGKLGHYSHNNFIELLCNLGIIGFIIYYYFYYKILQKTLRTNTPEANIVFSFFICLLILEMGIVTYYSNYLLHILICIAGITVYNRQKIY